MVDGWPPQGYDAQRLLASAPAGEVWAGRRRADGAKVVLKRLAGLEVEAAATIRRAAGAAAALGPHVLPPETVLGGSGDVVVVTRLADAGSLADLVERRGPLSAGEVVTVIAPLADVLADAHRTRFGHGAVSATNVVFSPTGRPMLTDFGIGAAVRRTPVTAADDVRALARLGLASLRSSGEDSRVFSVLQSAAAHADARRLGTELLQAAAALPVAFDRAAPVTEPSRWPATGPSRLRGPASRVAVLVVAVCVAAAIGVSWPGHAPTPAPLAAPVSSPPSPAATQAAATRPAAAPTPASWLQVMRRLERRRAAALVGRDLAGLRQVDVPGSRAARVDDRVVRHLRQRQLSLRSLSPAVRSADPSGGSATRMRLEVVDRLPGYVIVDETGDVVRRIHARGARRWTVTLLPRAGGWRISAVSNPQPTTAASAASTSS